LGRGAGQVEWLSDRLPWVWPGHSCGVRPEWCVPASRGRVDCTQPVKDTGDDRKRRSDIGAGGRTRFFLRLPAVVDLPGLLLPRQAVDPGVCRARADVGVCIPLLRQRRNPSLARPTIDQPVYFRQGYHFI